MAKFAKEITLEAKPTPKTVSKTMKAFVMRKIGEVGVIDKPIPEPGPNDAIIKTTAALICTSDTHTVDGGIGERINRTLGHESVGVIHRLGSAVKGFKEGDRVAVNAVTPCWRCENCQRGYPSQCGGMLSGYKFTNLKDGTMAEYFHVNDAEGNLAPIPSQLKDEQAVYCTDMMSTGIAGAERASIPLGGTVAIIGQGPVGLMSTAGARLLGAGLIITVDSYPTRRQLSKKYGADIVLDYKECDPVKEILKLTGGLGVDSAVEAIGFSETFETCVKVTRPGGTISNVGYHGKGDYVKLSRLDWGCGMGDKTIRTTLCPGGAERMKRLMRLIGTGRIDPTLMTTHRFKFSEIEKAFRMMQTKEGGMIKPLILF